MTPKGSELVRKVLAVYNARRREYTTLAFVAVLVIMSVALGLHQRGIAMTHTEQVLDCHYAGSGAHTHDKSCYDAAGNLVCPLTEREYHVHDDSCYTESRELVCGLEEHAHSDACYDEEGNLACGQDEHQHSDACYQVTRELTCGKDEVTETHTHGPGCFREVVVDDGESAKNQEQGAKSTDTSGNKDAESSSDSDSETTNEEMPAQTFSHQLKDGEGKTLLIVDADAPEGALPAGTTMQVRWIEPSTLTKKEQKAVDKAIAKKTDGKVLEQQAVDITFLDEHGQKVEPAKKVTVTFTSDLVDTKDHALVVHIDDLTEKQLEDQQKALEEGKTAEQAEPKRTAAPMDNLSDQVLSERDMSLSDDQLAIESDQFSIYVLSVATLEHTLEASDGGTYTVTLDAPASAGIPADAELRVSEVYADSDTHNEYEASAAEALGIEGEKVTLSRFFDIKIVGADGQEIQPVEPVQVKIELTDAPEGAAADVVHFDSETGEPEVVEASGSEGATSFEATGFSVYGVVYTVIIEAEDDGVYTFEGEDYTIKITCPEEANIPAGTELIVSELEPGSDEFLKRLGQTWNEVNKDYLEYREMMSNYNESMGYPKQVNPINIDAVRYFDISLKYDGKTIEPDVPVQVKVEYEQGLEAPEIPDSDEICAGVAHFVDEGVELIKNVETTTKNGAIVSFDYEQGSFSDTGTYLGQETRDMEAPARIASAPTPRVAEEGEEANELGKPVARKWLDPNKVDGHNDGTYTLNLSVTGQAKSKTETEVSKSNVLIVMDRSSSMINNDASNTNMWIEWQGEYQYGITYYGVDANGNPSTNLTLSRYWNDWYLNGSVYNGKVYRWMHETRLAAEQTALSSLVTSLLGENYEAGTTTEDGTRLDDIVEVKVISFASGRTDQEKANNFKRNNNNVTKYGDFENTESNWETSWNNVEPAITDNSTAKGTNWQEALQYAKEVADEKKKSQPDEPVYVIFITDGEPTDIEGDNGNAQYSSNNQEKESCLIKAEPDAKAIVDVHTLNMANGESIDTDHILYGIFTYGESITMKSYLMRLINYAYTGNDNANASDYLSKYYFDASDTSALENAFQTLLATITDSLAFGRVQVNDGLTMDAMTTTISADSTEGFRYSVKGPVGELYSVTAEDDPNHPGEPIVSFTIGTNTYTGTQDGVTKKEYIEKDEQGNDVHTGKYYYSRTVSDVEYKMTLASVDEDGQLTWDLSGVGTLMSGYTYTVSFVVWPDQDAYDYVTALNNKLGGDYKWDTKADTYEDLTSTKGYAIGGVKQYPSIVRYPNGVYAVLTNTNQSVNYSIVEEETVVDDNGNKTTKVKYTPGTIELDSPEPMPLTDTESRLEKVWNVERDNGAVLYQYLYESKDESDNPIPYGINFAIKKEGADYKQITLPGNVTETQDGGFDYDWSDYASEDMVEYKGKTFSKRWVQDYSIPTGLMLSTARLEADNLKTSDYSEHYTLNGVTYYVLETGHDFTVSEPDMYEFDFDAPTFHPMLVDGVLMNVEFTTEGGTKSIKKMTEIPVDGEGVSTLSITNTLRGYLHVDKTVVDRNGDPLTSDKTKFLYTITLTNEDSVFTDKHIPWFGINGLFYNDGNYSYYQAYIENGAWKLQNEAGTVFDITSTGFNPDVATAQTVTYLDAGGETKTLTLYGNQMTVDEDGDGKIVAAQFEITSFNSETLNIANVPDGTTYEVTETQTDGYGLVSVDWEIKKGEEVISSSSDGQTGGPSIDGATVTGTIVGNRDNWIHYKNRRDEADLEIYKVEKDTLDKDEKKYLEGAEFTVTMLDETGQGGYKLVESGSTQLVYQETFTSDEDGHITIPGLNPGYYEIVETKAPDGYILTSQPEYIKVDKGVIIRLNKTEDNASTTDINEGLVTNWHENTDNSGTIRFTAASPGNVATYLVGNEPGSELPSAGGPGTTVLSIVGAALIVAAAATLGMRRRRLSA